MTLAGKPKLIVVGGGEFARIVIEAARAQGAWDIAGFVDPRPCEETVRRLGISRLGDDTALRHLTDENLVLGIGTIGVSPLRERVVAKIGAAERWATIVHPFTSLSPTVRVAAGAVVLAGAVISTGAVVSEHAIVNLGATIDHDAHIKRFVHVAQQAAIGGGASIEEGAYIGMGAIVRDHVTVRAGTLVGMGAVVAREFPAGSVLIGVPARPMP